MSDYPLGAFEALNQMHDLEGKRNAAFISALKMRQEDMKKAEIIEYQQGNRTIKIAATSLLEENICATELHGVLKLWLKGQISESRGLFDSVCVQAFNSAVEFLAERDSEVGEW